MIYIDTKRVFLFVWRATTMNVRGDSLTRYGVSRDDAKERLWEAIMEGSDE